jgi:hypothetical protein
MRLVSPVGRFSLMRRQRYGRDDPAYSSRNTLIGSTLDARRAGIQHAARAISVSSAATSANSPDRSWSRHRVNS